MRQRLWRDESGVHLSDRADCVGRLRRVGVRRTGKLAYVDLLGCSCHVDGVCYLYRRVRRHELFRCDKSRGDGNGRNWLIRGRRDRYPSVVGVVRRIRSRRPRLLFRGTSVWESLRTRRNGVQFRFRLRHVADGTNNKKKEGQG